jgi:hypothetical protein
MEDNEQEEGMSTGKKVVAGAAIGVAVPAAVTVAKKLLGNGDGGEKQQQQTGGRSRKSSAGSTGSSRASATQGKSRAGSARSGASASKRSTGSQRKTPSSGGSSASRGSGRTKEQLYNQAKRLKIDGRSSMTKAQLERAISRKRS